MYSSAYASADIELIIPLTSNDDYLSNDIIVFDVSCKLVHNGTALLYINVHKFE